MFNKIKCYFKGRANRLEYFFIASLSIFLQGCVIVYYKQYSPDFIVALFLCFIYFLCLCAGLSATVRRANSFTKKGAWGFGFLFILYQISCVVGGSDSSGIWLMNIIANLVLLFYPPNKDEKHNLS